MKKIKCWEWWYGRVGIVADPAPSMEEHRGVKGLVLETTRDGAILDTANGRLLVAWDEIEEAHDVSVGRISRRAVHAALDALMTLQTLYASSGNPEKDAKAASLDEHINELDQLFRSLE